MENAKKGKGKASQAEILQRVNTVTSLLAMNSTRAYILQYASTKWGVGARTTDMLISRAMKGFRDVALVDRDLEIGRGILVRQLIIRKSFEQENYRQAQKSQSDLNRFLGLYAPTQKIVNVKDHREMTYEELTAKQVELLRKLGPEHMEKRYREMRELAFPDLYP